ncbi:MAG: hypothetical protein ACYCO9_13475 [Streptosporangiaceae bacterium]
MCSNPEERIAAIERAIDELAADAAAAYARPRRPVPRQGVAGAGQGVAGQGVAGQQGPTGERPADHADEHTAAQVGDPIVARLAELWALLAELDPDVAGRIPRYRA